MLDLVNWNVVEMSIDTGVDEGNHFVNGHWGVLLLLEEFGQLKKNSISYCPSNESPGQNDSLVHHG